MDESRRYTDVNYWNSRYSQEKDPFEWVLGYNSLKEYDIERFVKRTDAILFTGCGNSKLTRDMYLDGYHNLTAIDISEVVIQQAKERDRDLPAIKYEVMDCFNLSYPDNTFNVVLDKSTLDTFLCSEEMFDKIPQYLEGVSRTLTKDGVFMVISFNEPSVFDLIASLTENLSYEMAMRRWEADPSSETATPENGMYSYMYIFIKK